MFNLMVAFVTGLTSGGLSCLAVQGGLLASSLAHQIEQDIAQLPAKNGRSVVWPHSQIALPILLFLSAKLVAYTLLGFLLGALGAVIQLTPITRAILLFAIGIFMIGNALRMLNVHPIFRYFSIAPPSFVTRYLRRKARSKMDVLTPFFLGALTVLIPCGVTQAMMAVALGTGSPWLGAAIMFAFTLGTTPIFFTLAYFATRLGTTMEKHFLRFAAIVLLILGMVSIESGLNLIGAPISLTNLTRATISPTLVEADQTARVDPALQNSTTLTIEVKNNGYYPSILRAPADTALQLNLVTKNTRSCAIAVIFPDLNYQQVLPPSGVTTLSISPQPAGKVMYYSCSMGMFTGQIIFE